MLTGYPILHRMTQAEFDAGMGLNLQGGFIEIVGANGVPTGPMYLTGIVGSVPIPLGADLATYRISGEHIEHFRVVYDVDGVTCMKADPTDVNKCRKILGLTVSDNIISTNTEIIGQGDVAIYSGLPAGQMWLGAAGTITQTIPTTGFFVGLGWVDSISLMHIKLERPILLA